MANYRSVGSNGGILANGGNGSVPLGGVTVTFTVAVPATVGQGDELRFTGANAETLYILARSSAFQLTVQAPAASGHTGQNYQIRRAYTLLQDWENARDGDLVAENRSELGVAYADSTGLHGRARLRRLPHRRHAHDEADRRTRA